MKENSHKEPDVSPTASNQGLQSTRFRRIPRELSEASVKKLLEHHQNPYASDDDFVRKCAWFLELIYRQKLVAYGSGDDYVRLMSTLLAKNLGRNKDREPHYYGYIIKTLAHTGIITIDRSYQKSGRHKGKSKGFRLNIEKPQSLEQVEAKNQLLNQWEIMDEAHHQEQSRLQIDDQKMVLLQNLLDKSKGEAGIWFYENWLAGEQYVKVTDYNRIISPLTQLPSEYRDCFTIHEERVYEADIHACQPFLLLATVREQINAQQHKAYKMHQILQRIPEIEDYYIRIVEGAFYEHLFRIYSKIKKREIRSGEMAAFKEKLIASVFFADTTAKEPSGLVKLFQREYPIIFGHLQALKERYGYKWASHQLQRAESIVMNTAVDKLRQDASCSWQLRFHDALLCRESEVGIVVAAIEDSCLSYVGLKPRIKHGFWGCPIEELQELRQLPFTRVLRRLRYDRKIEQQQHRLAQSVFRTHAVRDVAVEKYKMIRASLGDEHNTERAARIKRMAIDRPLTMRSHWSPEEITAWKAYAWNFVSQRISEYESVTSSEHFHWLSAKERQHWQRLLSW